MKKAIITILFTLLFYNQCLADSYYFKQCKLSNAVLGDYIIDLEKNIIDVQLKTIDGTIQHFSDKIKSIQKNKIISDKIKSQKGENIYFQYFLNSKSKSVTKLEYKKQGTLDMEIFKLHNKRESFCTDVKTDWDKRKIDTTELNKEKKQISEAQEKIKKEQSSITKCIGNDYKKWTNCNGSFKAQTGRKYQGIFKDGKILKGISIYPGGAKYVGDFKDFKPHGYGTFLWANGDKYYGEWFDGKSHGNGTKIWSDGRKYLGQFQNDQLHGEGTLFYPEGKKYVGEFVNGKRHGKGTFVYSDGTAYIGKFLAGKEEGLGECVDEGGSTVACVSKDDTQVQDFSGKDTQNISIVSKKWVRISQYETNTKKGKKVMDKLKSDFQTKALELCSSTGNYNVLQKKMEILDLDETPAYGLETKIKIGISGVVECI